MSQLWRTTTAECEDRARILKQNSQLSKNCQTLSNCWSGHVFSKVTSLQGPSLMSKVKVPSVSQSVSDKSPIELFWTAKNNMQIWCWSMVILMFSSRLLILIWSLIWSYNCVSSHDLIWTSIKYCESSFISVFPGACMRACNITVSHFHGHGHGQYTEPR